jgi:hypothetical protein
LHGIAEDLQVSPVWLGQPEKEAQQRRLPGPIRADQTMDLALRDAEIDAIEGDDLSEGLADLARANSKLRRPAGSPAGRRVVTLFGCRPQTRQRVSELGM